VATLRPSAPLNGARERAVSTDSFAALPGKWSQLTAISSPSDPLFVNLVAVSAAPYGGARRGDALRLLPGGGIEVIRYPAT
jgi:hypothetical protein